MRAKHYLLALCILFLSLVISQAAAQQTTPAALPAETPQQRDQRLAWWRDARFGMFIHWGPVSLKGTEIGWSRGNPIPVEGYDNLYKQFNPTKFDAKQWVGIAKQAGMKYMVLTAKHHDGFSLFDSRFTTYTIMSTPFKRDVVRELADECRRQGLRFCTYYSIIDWYHPDYVPRGKGDKRPPGSANFDRYVTFMKNQLRELITNYGPLGILWFDGEWENTWSPERGKALYNYVRQLQPDIIINNRVGGGRDGMKGINKPGDYAGDYLTPEQELGAFRPDHAWETNMTICRQWAWKPDDQMKSLEQCIHALVMCATGDGNFLLNVGPMPTGEIEPRQVERLKEIGAWMKKYGESIYGTRGGPFPNGEWGGCTYKANVLYVHILRWKDNALKMPTLKQKIVKSTVLTGGEAKVQQTGEGITISIPAAQRDKLDTIVLLELDGPIPPPQPRA